MNKSAGCRGIIPLPGVGGAHKPYAAAFLSKHSEHRRCKMCDFHRWVGVFRQSEGSFLNREEAFENIIVNTFAPMKWAQCVGAGSGAPCRVSKGDGGKCVPSGHLREAQNDPQSSTETSVGYGSSLHVD